MANILNKYENVKFDDFIFNLYGKHINELKIDELVGREWGRCPVESYLPNMDAYYDFGVDDFDEDYDKFALEQLKEDYDEIANNNVVVEEHEMYRGDNLRHFRVIYGTKFLDFFDYYLDFNPMAEKV